MTLKIALDWTPNVNHIGILIAKDKGYFNERGLEVEILNPATDNYQITPGKKLDLGLADFAIAPFETVISLNNKSNPVDAVAVYAILQEDLSCIVTLQSSGLDRPAALAGKIYASYAARYEDKIVQAMLEADGATAPLQFVYPEKLGIWNTLLTGNADATWIFDNWEGVEAATQGIALHKFTLADYQIPYGYSPVIIARREKIVQHKQEYAAVIDAIKHGYLYAADHVEEAAAVLHAHVTLRDQECVDLAETVRKTIPYFGKTDCGRMDARRVEAFLQWLVDQGLETDQILQQALYSNALL